MARSRSNVRRPAPAAVRRRPAVASATGPARGASRHRGRDRSRPGRCDSDARTPDATRTPVRACEGIKGTSCRPCAFVPQGAVNEGSRATRANSNAARRTHRAGPQGRFAGRAIRCCSSVAWPCQAPLLAPRLARPAKRQDAPFIPSQALGASPYRAVRAGEIIVRRHQRSFAIEPELSGIGGPKERGCLNAGPGTVMD